MAPNTREIAEEFLGSDPFVTQLLKALGKDPIEELQALVSVLSRTRGASGQPPSIIIELMAKLATMVEGNTPNPKNPFWSLLSIAADTHLLGAIDRWEASQNRQLEALTPLLPLPEGRVLLCPVGILKRTNLDGLLHRAFVLSFQHDAKILIIELGFVDNLNEQLILDTLRGYPSHTMAEQLSIVVTGLDDPQRWNRLLSNVGVDSELVRCVTKITDI